MRNLIRNPGFFIFLILVGTTCNRSSPLTEADLMMIKETGFDQEILQEIRFYTNSVFLLSEFSPDQAIYYEDSVYYKSFQSKHMKGIIFNTETSKARNLIKKLGNKLKQKGYMIYISDSNYGYAPDQLTILRTTDKYDMLRFEATHGTSYGLYTEDIIRKLQEWDRLYEIDFIAVGNDFIEAHITKMPIDILGFCSELYSFCPDIVEQGTGTIDNLKNEILKTGKIYRWWN